MLSQTPLRADEAMQLYPVPQGEIVKHTTAAHSIQFMFRSENALFNRSDMNLEIIFDTGGKIVLTNFFIATSPQDLPTLILEDGTQVSSSIFLNDMEVDVTTKANAEISSHGESSYADATGNLLTGVDRLETKGSESFADKAGGSVIITPPSANLPPKNLNASTRPPSGNENTGGEETGGGEIPGGGVEEPGSGAKDTAYDARAVLIAQDGTEALNLQGLGVSSYAWTDPEYAKLFTILTNADGTLSIRLKEGATLPGNDQSIYAYLQVTGTDGNVHTVQILVQQGNSFDSSLENDNHELSGRNPVDEGLHLGEWVQGTSMQASYQTHNRISTSGHGDTISFSDGLAASSGTNSILTNSKENMQATVSLGSQTAANAIYSNNGGSNSIDGGQQGGTTDVFVTAQHYGMRAESTGKNSITADSVKITAKNTASAAYALHANGQNSQNLITANTDAELSASSGKGWAYGLNAENRGNNTIHAKGNITVKVQTESYETAHGMRASSQGSENNLIADKTASIDVQAGNFAYGMDAAGGNNTIKAKNAVISVESTGGTLPYSSVAVGMSAKGQGKNLVEAQDVSITSLSTKEDGGPVFGMHIWQESKGSENIINASGNVNIFTNGKTASGISIAAAGKNEITAKGNVGVTSIGSNSASGMSAAGVASKDNGPIINNIQANGNVTVSAISNGGAHGLQASNVGDGTLTQATNTITAGGDARITATAGTRQAYALQADDGGINSVTAKNISASAVSKSHESFGVMAKSSIYDQTAASNSLSATDRVEIYSNGGKDAYGIYVYGTAKDGTGSENTVNANEVSITTDSNAGKAYAMYAQGQSSHNTISAKTGVLIDASSQNDQAYGMFASYNGVNTIQATSDSTGIEVRIHVAAGQGRAAYAMYADHGENRIVASEYGVNTIRLQGDIRALDGGKNIISTGEHAKTLIELDGQVNTGGLTLETHSDSDVLILHASSVKEFLDRYEGWLKDINNKFDINAIEVFFSDPALQSKSLAELGLGWLENLFPGKLHNLTQSEYDDQYATTEDFAKHEPNHVEAPQSRATLESTASERTDHDEATPEHMGSKQPAHVVDAKAAGLAEHLFQAEVQAVPASHQELHTPLQNPSLQPIGTFSDDKNPQAEVPPQTSVLQSLNAQAVVPPEHDGSTSADRTSENIVSEQPIPGAEALAAADLQTSDTILAPTHKISGMIHEDSGSIPLVLPVESLQDLSNGKVPLENLQGQSDVWLQLDSGHNDTIRAEALAELFKAMDDSTPLFVFGDEHHTLDTDSLGKAGWQASHNEAIVDVNGTAASFNLYTNPVTPDDMQMLYIQTSILGE